MTRIKAWKSSRRSSSLWQSWWRKSSVTRQRRLFSVPGCLTLLACWRPFMRSEQVGAAKRCILCNWHSICWVHGWWFMFCVVRSFGKWHWIDKSTIAVLHIDDKSCFPQRSYEKSKSLGSGAKYECKAENRVLQVHVFICDMSCSLSCCKGSWSGIVVLKS